MRALRLRRPRSGTTRHGMPRSRMATGDVYGEAVAAILQRPLRAALTALGTILGVGAFIAVLGLTATAGGQIDARFTALVATEVVVEQVETEAGAGSGSDGTIAFPQDADARVDALIGVRHAGVWWTVRDVEVTSVPLPGAPAPEEVEVRAASPGLLGALRPTIGHGRLYDEFHDSRAEPVAVLGSAVASRLGINNLAVRPAILIDGIPFTVVGIIDDVQRHAEVLFTVLVPRGTAEAMWGPPDSDTPVMLVDTEVGAAQVVADQAALALRPDAPEAFRVIPPPDPRTLREGVATDLSVLFLLLAGVSLVIGAVGIANTTMVAVLERVPEIGLRRAVGARRRHIAAQFLTESAIIGTMGGLLGTSLGVIVVVTVALVRQWTPLIEPWTAFPAPLAGTLIGLLAGAYPALRASRIEPVEALRR